VSIHDVLKSDDWTLAAAADRADGFGFDFVGASDALFDLDASFSDARFPQYVLQEAIEELAAQNAPESTYDFCLVDCPPALGLAVTMALCASDGILVPTTLESMSIQGLGKLIQDIDEVRKRANPSLDLLGIVATMVDVRRRMTPELDEALQSTYGDKYLGEYRIRPRTTISEASALGTTIYDRSMAKGNQDYTFYDDLTRELLSRMDGVQAPAATG
jgi:chromosome partitioning protein